MANITVTTSGGATTLVSIGSRGPAGPAGPAGTGGAPIPRSTAQGPPDASVAPVILGRLCILGDAGGAYRTFHAVQLSPVIWLETTPGVVTNTTRSVAQKLTTTGTATNEVIQIADL